DRLGSDRQKNLAINGGTSFAPGAAGTVALPILSTLFAGLPTAKAFGSSTFITNLNNNNVGAMAFTLANSPTYRANRANLAPNFFLANPNAVSRLFRSARLGRLFPPA